MDEIDESKLTEYQKIYNNVTATSKRMQEAIKIAQSIDMTGIYNAIAMFAGIQEKIASTVSPIVDFLQKVDWAPIIRTAQSLQEIASSKINFESFISNCMEDLNAHHWFPSIAYEASLSFLFEFVDIKKHTRPDTESKKRKIDKLIFAYFGTSEIKEIKCQWKGLDAESWFKRIILEAISAYEHKKYATTVIVLVTLWQGIIANKSDENGYRIDTRTKKLFHNLLEVNEMPEFYYQFFDNCIYYNCTRIEDVKKDVPGRHGIAHGWFTEYPSRKAALNAILFTDCLIKLQPIKK